MMQHLRSTYIMVFIFEMGMNDSGHQVAICAK
jgi:hypothetical protein